MAAMTQRYCLRPRAAFAALLLGLGLLCSGTALPQGNSDALQAQRRIEAAYLYKFSSYITWPAQAFANPGSPLIIGVAGDDDMADELTTIVANRQVNGHNIVVQRVHAGQSIAGMHLLFVAAGTAQGQTLIDAAHGNYSVCVTEGDDGLERGCDMSFVLVNDRVRFDISLDTTQASGVKVSSQLLSVADKVTGAPP